MSERSVSGPWFWSHRERVALAVCALAAVAGVALSRGARNRPNFAQSEISYAVDPNDASYEVLVTLPGLGPARARAIIGERARGRFRSVREVAERVPGIGPATAAAIAPYLRFDDDENGNTQ